MQKNQVVKKLLAVTAVAAMFSAFGVQAQTSGQSAQSMSNQTATGKPNMTGKTAADGTVNNTSSMGTEDRSATAGASGSQGMTHSSGDKSHTGDTMQSTSGASGAAGATASGAAKLGAADKKAIMDMALANMAEVETGKLALSKSQNAEVKTFAQQMIDDHGKALTEVQALAQSKGVTLPTELDRKHKAMSAKLEKLTGEAFDREYMKTAGVTDHKQTHDKLKKGAKSAKDPDVKALATKMMPTVEQHLKAAQQMTSAKSGTTSGK